MKSILITILAFSYMSYACAQSPKPSKKREYNVWVNKPPRKTKAILYQVKDSSIVVYTSPDIAQAPTSPDMLKEISYADIDILKIRYKYGKRNGVIWGASSGFVAGTSLGLMMLSDYGASAFAVSLYLGAVEAIPFAGVGYLIGSIKDRMPIYGDFARFNAYRGDLMNYSYTIETGTMPNLFQHRWYVGTNMGVIMPTGPFFGNTYNHSTIDLASVAFGSKSMVGYRFNQSLGVRFTSIYGSIDELHNNDGDYVSVDVGTIGPVFTQQLSPKATFNFSPSVGSASITELKSGLYTEGYIENITGSGFGWGVDAWVDYKSSKRWNFSAETGYFTSMQKYDRADSHRIGFWGIEVGASYKFGSKSL